MHVIRHLCSEFWGLKLHQISNFPGVPPRIPLGELTYSAPPHPSLPPPQELHPRSRPFGPLASFPSSLRGKKFRPLKINLDRRHWVYRIELNTAMQPVLRWTNEISKNPENSHMYQTPISPSCAPNFPYYFVPDADFLFPYFSKRQYISISERSLDPTADRHRFWHTFGGDSDL